MTEKDFEYMTVNKEEADMDQSIRYRSCDAVKPHRTHPSLCQVRLLPGTPFYDRQQEMLQFLLVQDTGSLLYNFRKATGLPTGDAEPMTGWDADECKLKGHTTGHYLSAVSLAYAATGDERFRTKASEIVAGFAECQQAFASSGKTHPGFLSAYDEEQFDLLEKFTKYPDIWAPYYTLDKIMAGLLDAYELTGSEQALDVLDPLGSWIYDRLSKVSDEDRTKMWSMYIAGEYGAMIGTLVRLWRLTGKDEHLAAARLFENASLFDQMAEGRDELDTMHANQHIPQIIGALELYAATGEKKYLDIARNFERFVTEHHTYMIGGTGEQERFHAADSECSYLTDKTAESCASVNMLRLTSELFEYEQEARHELMDYYELTLFNHILMSCSHRADGGTTYFMPLAPGSCKHYETEENSCCHGTGMESRFRYMRDIFSYEGEGEAGVLRIDLPVSSRLDGEEKVTVKFSDEGTLTITAGEDMHRMLAVRIPLWSEGHFKCSLSEKTADMSGSHAHADAGEMEEMQVSVKDGYAMYGRLKAGQSVSLSFPMKLRKISAESDGRYYSLAWGPYLLAAISDSEEFMNLSLPELLACSKSEKESFHAGNVLLKPLFDVDSEHYHVYFLN